MQIVVRETLDLEPQARLLPRPVKVLREAPDQLHRGPERGYTSTMPERVKSETDMLLKALREQADGAAHDRGLIVERLGWTPDQRLEANASFVRFYLSIRPQGPLIRE
jgi:hypothetical protein